MPLWMDLVFRRSYFLVVLLQSLHNSVKGDKQSIKRNMKISIPWILLFTLHLEYIDAAWRSNCPRITVAFGRVRIRNRGRIARFRCRRRFQMYGRKLAVCIGTKWSHPPPVCVSTRCQKMTYDSSLITTEELNGAVIKFQCKAGKELVGKDEIYCVGRKYVGSPPVCRDRIPESSCDFEMPDLCGWTQDIQDNFDWKMGTMRTPTAATGPERDHTFPNQTDGHYMYIESSAPRQDNDFARLLSPYYNVTDGGLCFDFWYHMKGPDGAYKVGELEVFIREEGDEVPDPSNSSFVPDFYRQGNQGDKWKRGKIEIGTRYKKYQFVIVGTRLNSYVSDIAIDDVRVYNCSDDVEFTTVETSPFSLSTLQTDSKTTTSIIESTIYQDTTSYLVSGNVSKFATISKTDQLSTFPSTTKKRPETMPTTKTITTVRSTVKPSTSTLTFFKLTNTMITTTEENPVTSIPAKEEDTSPSTETITSPSTESITSSVMKNTSTSGPKSSAVTIKTSTTSKSAQPSSVQTTTDTLSIDMSTLKVISTRKDTKSDNKSTVIAELTSEILGTIDLEPTTSSSTNYTFVNDTLTEVPQNDSVVSMYTTTTKRPAIISDDKFTKKTQIPDTSNDTGLPDNNPEPPNVVLTPVGDQKSTSIPIKPLMIGVGVGVAIGLIIVFIGVYLWIKRKRRKDLELTDEMRPITKSSSHEW